MTVHFDVFCVKETVQADVFCPHDAFCGQKRYDLTYCVLDVFCTPGAFSGQKHFTLAQFVTKTVQFDVFCARDNLCGQKRYNILYAWPILWTESQKTYDVLVDRKSFFFHTERNKQKRTRSNLIPVHLHSG